MSQTGFPASVLRIMRRFKTFDKANSGKSSIKINLHFGQYCVNFFPSKADKLQVHTLHAMMSLERFATPESRPWQGGFLLFIGLRLWTGFLPARPAPHLFPLLIV
jgi:hypothetical protein